MYRYFFLNLMFLCNSFYLKYFNESNIWFTLNDYIFITFFSSSSKFKLLCKKFFLQRIFFYSFGYTGNRINLCFNTYKFIIKGSDNSLNPLLNVYYLFSFLFVDHFLHKQVLFCDSISKDSLSLMKMARYSFVNFINFFDFQYTMFNYYSLAQFTAINNLKSRIKPYKFSAFTGFKIQCLGRFSRKQRSTSFWFSLGTVPLNTVQASVNYGFYTLPLRNSAVTVKTWINCSNSGSLFWYQII